MCRKELISEKKAGEILARYFALLSHTGYVKHKSLVRILAILFILDMLKYMSEFINEKDYCELSSFIGRLGAIDCILPYSVFCTNRTQYFGYDDNFTHQDYVDANPELELGDFNFDFNTDFYL